MGATPQSVGGASGIVNWRYLGWGQGEDVGEGCQEDGREVEIETE